jgi:hypothetical protein
MTVKRDKFAVSDLVAWSSQAAGSWKEKRGEVVKVVPAGAKVPEGYGVYGARDHESYVVRVPSKSGRGRGTYYWPVVSKLKKIG